MKARKLTEFSVFVSLEMLWDLLLPKNLRINAWKIEKKLKLEIGSKDPFLYNNTTRTTSILFPIKATQFYTGSTMYVCHSKIFHITWQKRFRTKEGHRAVRSIQSLGHDTSRAFVIKLKVLRGHFPKQKGHFFIIKGKNDGHRATAMWVEKKEIMAKPCL